MPLFIIWTVMMILMIFSRSEYLWPECYFVLFLCYYLTDRTQEQRRNVTLGIIDGIILGFIVIQAHSLLFRPYDIVGYMGNFCNPNHNCVFLCFCLAAILSKILYLKNEKAKRSIIIFFCLLAEACYSFIFMTISRSGYLTTFFITVVFLIMYCRTVSQNFFQNGNSSIFPFYCNHAPDLPRSALYTNNPSTCPLLLSGGLFGKAGAFLRSA